MSSIGVDVGGTKILAGRVSSGKIVARHQVATGAKEGKNAVIANLISAIDSVMDKNVSAIGIGHPGPLDYRTGIIGNAVNLPMHGVNLRQVIGKRFHLPVAVDNDAKCFTLGEARFGEGKGKSTVLGITLGTGVGSGLVVDGKLYHGRGNAMEFGHTSIAHDGRLGRCGNHGCLERYIGTVGLLHSALETGLKVRDGKELSELAKAGNAKARRIYDDYGYYLGVGLANAVDCFDPDIIVIGGNLTRSWGLFSRKAIAEMRKRSLVRPCPVVRSTLADAAVLGAASLT